MSGKQGEWSRIGVNGGGLGGRNPGDKPLTLTRCYSYMNLLKGGSPFVVENTT